MDDSSESRYLTSGRSSWRDGEYARRWLVCHDREHTFDKVSHVIAGLLAFVQLADERVVQWLVLERDHASTEQATRLTNSVPLSPST